ncbi:MAG TPA: S8 family peptidase [Phycisphaerae bacterium]|nr:S8 family peptidase [Phycisphaerae bacterium]
MEAQTSRVQVTPEGLEPEFAVVLETVGTIEEFKKAVDRIEGLAWLVEWDEEDIAADDDFYDARHPEKPLSGRLYLVMTNQRGIQELLSLWHMYLQDENAKFPYGQTKLREVFKQLRDIRRWGVQDRIRETGVLEYWQEMVSEEDEVFFETELWFRSTPERRVLAHSALQRVVQSIGGQCVAEAVIPEIRYHGVLVRAPASDINHVLRHAETELVRLEDVVFFRPVGQAKAPLPSDDEPTEPALPPPDGTPGGSPVVALFDGLPLANHPLLARRLVIDDPDGWAETYPADHRWHGTAMASLIAHGDLEEGGDAQSRPIYVRPVMRPNSYDWHEPPDECIPHTALPLDLIHRAVVRMAEGEGQDTPASPEVRVVNLSICDRSRPFVREMSPLARLLDWLAWKYGILFVVSAGNQTDDVELNVPRDRLGGLDANELQTAVFRSIAADIRNRRILSPAEGVNVLTVGAAHSDASEIRNTDRRIDPVKGDLPAPYSALGHGYRHSVKPDILMPGGRQLLCEKMGSTHANATLQFPARPLRCPPGHRVACPGAGHDTAYVRGTSNAAALACRGAGLLYDRLIRLREQPNGALLEEGFMAVLMKGLLVHGAEWGGRLADIAASLETNENRSRFSEYASRFLGYGAVDVQRIMACTDQRATVIGVGTLCEDEAHEYRLPLPPALGGHQIWKRLTVTLAWITPLNLTHRAYRRAHLWFTKPEHALSLARDECHWQATQRGTVQHDVFVGDRADAFADGDFVKIQVNCRADAGELEEEVRYALVVTLEVAPGIDVRIYQEIRDRIQVRVPITPE